MHSVELTQAQLGAVVEETMNMLARAEAYRARAAAAAGDWDRGFYDGQVIATQIAAFKMGELFGLVEKGMFEHVGEEVDEYRRHLEFLRGGRSDG
jgi:hypothetical protein